MLTKKDISFNQQNQLNVTNMNKANHKHAFSDEIDLAPVRNEEVETKKISAIIT